MNRLEVEKMNGSLREPLGKVDLETILSEKGGKIEDEKSIPEKDRIEELVKSWVLISED